MNIIIFTLNNQFSFTTSCWLISHFVKNEVKNRWNWILIFCLHLFHLNVDEKPTWPHRTWSIHQPYKSTLNLCKPMQRHISRWNFFMIIFNFMKTSPCASSSPIARFINNHNNIIIKKMQILYTKKMHWYKMKVYWIKTSD